MRECKLKTGFPSNLAASITDVLSAKYAARQVFASFVFAQSNIPGNPINNQSTYWQYATVSDFCLIFHKIYIKTKKIRVVKQAVYHVGRKTNC